MQRQATARICWSGMGISLLFAVCLISTPVSGSPSPEKRSESDRDIGAIGHRKIARRDPNPSGLKEMEKEIAAQWSTTLERSTPLLRDATTALYVERLAQTVAQNSDARFPIIVRIIDSEEVYALTLPAGYQYITRGLLMRIGNEGELASVLARGIAHTALRSAMHEPLKATRDFGSLSTPSRLVFAPDPSKFDKFEREEELNADYFGIQYLYKSGYDPGCFLTLVQTVWADNPAKVFRAFPPIPERLKALQDEISDILPKRDGAVTNTPEFADFREHLLKLNSPKSETNSEPKPVPGQVVASLRSPDASSQQDSSAPKPADGSSPQSETNSEPKPVPGQAVASLRSPEATSQQNPSAPKPADGSSRCADIASADPQFALLAKTCDFVLSPRYLPNFICRETVKRSNGDAKRAKWNNLDVVTAEVRFERGTGTDRYFNVNIDGRLITGSTNLSSSDLGDYLALYHPGGMWGYGEFGVELTHVFVSSSRTSFKLHDGGDPSLPSAAVFDFHIDKANSKFLLNAGEMHTRSGIDGSLWIDSVNSKLLRMEFNAKDIENDFPIKDFSGRINFGDVSIADAGQFLLPVESEAVECQRDTKRCYRNVLEFHDCRKFGAESRIVLK